MVMETSSPAKHTYNTWYAAKNHYHIMISRRS